MRLWLKLKYVPSKLLVLIFLLCTFLKNIDLTTDKINENISINTHTHNKDHYSTIINDLVAQNYFLNNKNNMNITEYIIYQFIDE